MSTPMKFLHSDFEAASAKNSGAMKKIMANEDVAHALRDRSKQETFYNTLKKYGGSRDALQKTLGELRADKKDGISSDTARAIAKELIKNGRRFVTPQDNQRQSLVASAPGSPGPSSQRPAPSQPSAGPQLSSRLTKNNSSIMGSGLVANH